MADQTGERATPAVLDVPYPSKVELPARRNTIVHRERLIDALAEVAHRRVAVISAPPGYGKTTLLKDFASTRKEPVLWYSLDERDVDATTFLRYFVAAGRVHWPSFGEQLANELASGREFAAEEMTDLLVSATASAPAEFILILDDYHFLESASDAFRQAIEGWVYRLPPGSHVVISGRTRPRISVLPMMSVRQEVVTIGATDFSFTAGEVAQLFRQVLEKDISLDDAQRLADLTEGWVGALVLMADRVQASGAMVLEQLTGSDMLFQYISLEQFQPLPQDLKDFLLGSAVLRWLDVGLANQLLGIRDAEEKINRLALLNLVVPPKDGGLFRYHRLFRSFLVSNLRANDGARFRDLNNEAARLNEQNERWDDAVYHYIQATAWDSIIAITDRHGSRMFEEGRWETLAEWLDAVPDEELERLPKLVLWKARVLHHLHQTDKALSLLSTAIKKLEDREEFLTLAQAEIARGICLRVKGEYEESADSLRRAKKLLAEHGGSELVSTEARKELGITLRRSGRMEESIEELTAVVDVYEANGDRYNLGHSLVELATTLGMAGRLAASATYLERARPIWEHLGHPYFLVQVLNNLGMAYYMQGDLPRGEEMFVQGLAKARESNNMREILYLTCCLADLKKEGGEYQNALEMYHQTLTDTWVVNDAYFNVYVMDAIADTYRLMGDIPLATSASERALAEAEKTGGGLELGISLMTSALIKRQQDDLKPAVEQLEKAISHLKEKGAGRELATAYFHMAGLYFSLKKKTLALDMLALCGEITQELGYDHFLLVEATRNPLLVQYAAANKLNDGYYNRMLRLVKPGVTTEEGDEESETGESPTGKALYAYGFGNLRVESGGREITDLEWRSEKSKEMFFFFLTSRRPLRKEEIVTALWPDMPEEKTTSAFHSNMYRLRKALYQDVIAKDSGRYVLDPSARFVFDVEDYQAAVLQADAAARGSPEAIAAMERALGIYKGQFAADFYSEWAQNLRSQLEEQQMSLLGQLATAYNEIGEYKKSADVCQRIIEVDEYNEAAWYRLMSNYIQSGQDEAAKYCYNRYVQLISEDVDDEVPTFDDIVSDLADKRRS